MEYNQKSGPVRCLLTVEDTEVTATAAYQKAGEGEIRVSRLFAVNQWKLRAAILPKMAQVEILAALETLQTRIAESGVLGVEGARNYNEATEHIQKLRVEVRNVEATVREALIESGASYQDSRANAVIEEIVAGARHSAALAKLVMGLSNPNGSAFTAGETLADLPDRARGLAIGLLNDWANREIPQQPFERMATAAEAVLPVAGSTRSMDLG